MTRGMTHADGGRRMVELTLRLLELLAPEDRERACTRMDDPELRSWTYLPGDRPGLPLETASADVDALVAELVDAAHSPQGTGLVTGAREVERERRRLVTGATPEGDRYWWRVVGDPGGEGPWGWRLNGHHVAVHVVVGPTRTTLTPHFIGAEPALVPSGPMAGRRLLGPEEDLARDLVGLLRAGQREQAVSDVPPADILTGDDPVADPGVLPRGIRRRDLDIEQRRALDALVRRYLDRAPADYAAECWAEAMDLAAEDMEFAWAGPTEVGAPHYYCVRTPSFLIEYDNTQDDANHAHSVWRHLRDDFGGDALRHHLRTAHG